MTTISLVVYKNCNYVFYFIIKHYTVKLYNEAVYFHSTQIWIWKRQQFINLYSLLNIQVNQPARFSLHFHSVNSVLIKYKYEVFWVYICYVTHFYSYVLFTMRESHCNNYVLMAKDLVTFWPSAGFPGATVVKNPPAHAGDARGAGSIPGSGRPSEEGNVLVWRIPWKEEPGRLQSMGMQRWMLDETEHKWGSPLNATPLLHLGLSQWRTHSQFKSHWGGLPWWSSG